MRFSKSPVGKGEPAGAPQSAKNIGKSEMKEVKI
nr:MAG TPA: hypothetical protein [Caudoviricetes sp.]